MEWVENSVQVFYNLDMDEFYKSIFVSNQLAAGTGSESTTALVEGDANGGETYKAASSNESNGVPSDFPLNLSIDSQDMDLVTTTPQGTSAKKNGHCFLIVNHSFTNASSLDGYKDDARRISEIFDSALNFKVITKWNCRAEEILMHVSDWCNNTDFADDKYVAVFLLSHGGEKRTLYGTYGQTVDIEDEIIQRFIDCKSLKGKPKLFFIQACRGHLTPTSHSGDSVPFPAGSSAAAMRIARKRDRETFAYYSTVKDYESYVDHDGAVFLKQLCIELETRMGTCDLSHIVTAVNDAVSRKCINKHIYQSPEAVSALLDDFTFTIPTVGCNCTPLVVGKKRNPCFMIINTSSEYEEHSKTMENFKQYAKEARNLFNALNFQIEEIESEIRDDLESIFDEIIPFSKKFLSVDCFSCVIVACGGEDEMSPYMFCSDKMHLRIEWMIRRVCDNPELSNVPKVFFVILKKCKKKTTIASSVPGVPASSARRSKYANVFLYYVVLEDGQDDTNFFQELSQILISSRGNKEIHLDQIARMVNKKMKETNRKEIPEVSNTLTQLVCFASPDDHEQQPLATSSFVDLQDVKIPDTNPKSSSRSFQSAETKENDQVREEVMKMSLKSALSSNTSTSTPKPSATSTSTSPASAPVSQKGTVCGSVGAAGTKYSGYEEAGKEWCHRHCKDFPVIEGSHTIPSLFEKKVLDSVDFLRDPTSLTEQEQKCCDGLKTNLSGEEAEKFIFDIFTTLTRKKQSSEHFLLIHNVVIDGNSKGNVKRHALFKEFPNLDENINTKGEFDLIVLIRNAGVIVGEIKRTAEPIAVAKAETQMEASDHLTKDLMRVLSGGLLSNLPSVKMLLIPEELSPSRGVLSENGSYVLHRDLCADIHSSWEKMIEDLKKQKQISSFTDKDFERLTHVIVGLWAAKVLKKGRGITFDNKAVSEEIDDNVTKQKLSSIKKHHAITKVSPCQPSEVFQNSAGGFSLLYLSPQQRQLFDSTPVALVNGNAGCGKSLCIIFKVMELQVADKSKKTLIVAPYPHDYRLKRVLGENDIDAEIITSFPPPMNSTTNVFIISLDMFFGVAATSLLSYQLQDYHLFVDDLHTYQRMSDDVASFSDIAQFVELIGHAAQSSQMLAWFCLDPVQGGLFDSDEYSVHLFKQKITVPVVTLPYVLRNATEIIDVAEEARSDEIFAKSKLELKGIIESFDAGHAITSTKVLYHKLQKKRNMKCSVKEYKTRFICQRVEDEIRRITGVDYPGAYSHITILFDVSSQLEDNQVAIEKILKSKFNTTTQTIESFERNGDNNGIVMDEVKNVMSYETMCVIYVKTSHGYDYNAVTRARVILTIIDIITDAPPMMTKKMDVLKWKDNGTDFTEY